MSQRFDLYAVIHKALRNYMGAVLMELGRLDLTDERDTRRCSAALLGLVDWLEGHLAIEERFVHSALAQRRPSSLLEELRRDHDEHQRSFALLRSDAEALVSSLAEPADARRSRARHLYLALSRFVAENYLHMAVEETEMNALLWESFSDEELLGIYQAIMASEGRSDLERAVTWLLPAIPPDERVKLIAGARLAMPASAFDDLALKVREVLGARDFEKLARALALTVAA
ncbi:MAG TPA: hemerythrin domain-containing protein [Polyangiaceae bacterium]